MNIGSLIRGATRAATGAMQGQEIARERESEEVRRDALMRMQTDQFKSLQEMRAAQLETERQRAEREQNLDKRDAYEGGYRSVGDASQRGRSMTDAAMQFGGMPQMGAGLGAMGAGMQAKAANPTYAIGGEGFTKTDYSTREREQRDALAARREEQEADRIARAAEREGDRAFQVGQSEATRAHAERMAAASANLQRELAGMRSSAPRTAAEFREVQGLRKEFEGLIKPYKDVVASTGKIESLANAAPSPQTDIALLFSYMKALDPTSVVRESEYATAEQARGVPEDVLNLYNRTLKGQRLTPQQRQRIAQTAGTLRTDALGNYAREADRFTDLAGKYQFDPTDVIGSRLDRATTGSSNAGNYVPLPGNPFAPGRP